LTALRPRLTLTDGANVANVRLALTNGSSLIGQNPGLMINQSSNGPLFGQASLPQIRLPQTVLPQVDLPRTSIPLDVGAETTVVRNQSQTNGQLRLTAPSQTDELQRPEALLAPRANFNQYFFLPQPVSSIYTGREALLEEIKLAFDSSLPEHTHVQRRFVVFGLGGSGKTQLCFKYAQDNRDK